MIDEVSEKVNDEIKKQEGGFHGMLLEHLGASVSGNMLTRKGAVRAGKGKMRVGRGYNNMDKKF